MMAGDVVLTPKQKNRLLDSVLPSGRSFRWYLINGNGASKDDLAEWVYNAVRRVMESDDGVDVVTVQKD